MALLLAGESSRAFAGDRPTGPIHKTRSAVLAKNGMAATSQPLAAQTAIKILQGGGNAVDAAIAANAVIGVVEPESCGLGGDLFAIVWDAKSKKLFGLNASGRAPYQASIELFKKKGLAQIPIDGPFSWSTPGCVDGWSELSKRFGTKSLSELLQPAIAYASEGFPVSEVIASDWKAAAEELAKTPTSAACYLPGGKAPKYGEVFKNPYLAKTLQKIAEGGRDAFYKGSIADEIVAYSKRVGGLFSKRDFDEHSSTWVEPVSTTYRGFEVWELPPNGQGIAALQMLNMLEPYDIKSMGQNSAQALHLMIEAKKLAFEDRAKFYADPQFSKVPVSELISKPYADKRRASIDRKRASDHPASGDPGQSETIYMTVVDREGNCVSLIQSVFSGFGSLHVPGELGFALQNRGCLFALDPSHANRLEPHKRPFHTIIPGFVTRDGKPWLSFGVMGGDMQPQGHVQVLVNMIDFGMDVQEAGDAPRFRHFGSSDPTGIPAQKGGTVVVESGVSAAVRAKLESMGHKVVSDRSGFGGYQAIRVDLENGVLIGGSDPRKDGCAIGY